MVVAKANAVLQASPVQLAPTRKYVDRWTSAFQKDPFGVSVEEKLELIHGAAVTLKKDPKIMLAFGFLAFRAEDKYFASSEGSSIQQYIVQVFPLLQATAVDIQKNISRTRSYTIPPATAGWEAIAKANLGENAPRVREEALEHLAAPPVTPGKKDLVLLPSHLWLTIHESIGHSTELDRALGYEANFAGTSFMTTEKMGNYRVGSELMKVFGDRTNRRRTGHREVRRRWRADHQVPHHRKRRFQALPDHSRPGAPGGREGIARLLLRRFLVQRAVPAHAQRVAGSRAARGHAGFADLRRGRRHPDRRRRQFFHRPAALQLPVRRRRLLADQGRQEGGHDFPRGLPGEDHATSGAPATASRDRLTGSSSAVSSMAKANRSRSTP